jgi:recombination protein RecA
MPGDELEPDHRDFTGEIDQLFARALPRIASAAAKSQTCILLLDQLRHDHEVIFGRQKVSTGGEAIAHCSSIRLELTKLMAQKHGDNVVGYGVKASVLKSCVGPPFRVAEWTINFERGIDPEFELVEQGISRGVIVKQPTGLMFQGNHLGISNNAAREYLQRHTDVAALVETSLRAAMKRMNTVMR